MRSVGVELFHADGQTDMTKLITALRSFANAPKSDCFSTKALFPSHRNTYWLSYRQLWVTLYEVLISVLAHYLQSSSNSV